MINEKGVTGTAKDIKSFDIHKYKCSNCGYEGETYFDLIDATCMRCHQDIHNPEKPEETNEALAGNRVRLGTMEMASSEDQMGSERLSSGNQDIPTTRISGNALCDRKEMTPPTQSKFVKMDDLDSKRKRLFDENKSQEYVDFMCSEFISKEDLYKIINKIDSEIYNTSSEVFIMKLKQSLEGKEK